MATSWSTEGKTGALRPVFGWIDPNGHQSAPAASVEDLEALVAARPTVPSRLTVLRWARADLDHATRRVQQIGRRTRDWYADVAACGNRATDPAVKAEAERMVAIDTTGVGSAINEAESAIRTCIRAERDQDRRRAALRAYVESGPLALFALAQKHAKATIAVSSGGRGKRSPVRARGAGRPRAAAGRSSARSGDSGDDGPGGPASALEPLPHGFSFAKFRAASSYLPSHYRWAAFDALPTWLHAEAYRELALGAEVER